MLSFSDTLHSLRYNHGKRAYRLEWTDNPQNPSKFIYVEKEKVIKNEIIRKPQKAWIGEQDMNIHAHLVMYDDALFIEWSPSQQDLFALDWCVF